MDVISSYFTKRGKISLNKRLLKTFIYGIILGAWAIFCICAIPKLQEQQRQKVRAQERQILQEIRAEQSTYTRDTTFILESSAPPIEQVTKTQEQITAIDPPKYIDKDLILLAQLIEAEGGIESYQCKLYIGSVVLNRMVSDEFPDNLYDVIFQVNNNGVHQFSVTMVNQNGTRAIDCEPSEDSLSAAAELLTYGTQLPEDVMVFYTENCKGKWVNNRETYTQIDNTIFAYIYAKEED